MAWCAQVIYPLSVAEAVAMEGEGSNAAEAAAVLDARLDALMGVVRLQYLVAREGGWGATAEWGEVLSLGMHHRSGGLKQLITLRTRPGWHHCCLGFDIILRIKSVPEGAVLRLLLVTATLRIDLAGSKRRVFWYDPLRVMRTMDESWQLLGEGNVCSRQT